MNETSMPSDEDRHQAYALRVACAELDHLETVTTLQDYPHVARFVARPGTAFVLKQIQNFCWTVERFMRKARLHFARALLAPGVEAPALAPSTARSDLPKLWIDVTDTYRFGFNGGISRVVLNLAGAAAATGTALPVVVEGGAVHEYVGPARIGRRLSFGPGVTYVVADSFWSHLDETREACRSARKAGAKIVLCVHDIIPFYQPSLSRAAFARFFVAATNEMLDGVDGCIAVSRYTADKVRDLVAQRGSPTSPSKPVAHFHLGADGLPRDVSAASDKMRKIFARPNTFLSVGTLEPRKGYPVTLDAFDELWARGCDAAFVIVGRSGWLSQALAKRIRTHPRFGTSLFWLEHASDIDLAFAYRSAYCLIQASITEGFGLPIVEASVVGTPVIATDNAIFRELAGDAITYFRSCDAADLAARIAAAIERRPTPGELKTLSWTESLTQMAEQIAGMIEAPAAADSPPVRAQGARRDGGGRQAFSEPVYDSRRAPRGSSRESALQT